MRNYLLLGSVAGLMLGLLYLMINPAHGLAYENPMTAVSLGLVGLGICIDARQRRSAAK